MERAHPGAARNRRFRLADLAREVGGRVTGDGALELSGIAPLDAAGPEDLSFLTHPRYRAQAEQSGAGAILARTGTRLPGRAVLECDEPQLALARLLEVFHPPVVRAAGISADARIGRDVRIGSEVRIESFAVIGDRTVLGDGVRLGAGVVVGEDCRIGDRTQIEPGVVLYPGTVVGARCLLHAGVVLGADGFGFVSEGGRHRKIPQVGRTRVDDDVEIGANAAVDRAALGETVIGEGSKLDDLVMVAHGVRVGRATLMAAQSGIAGSSRLGAHVTLAGQSGVAGHLRVGDGVTVAAKSAVFDDQPDGGFVAGIPAVDHRLWKRVQASARRLPELRRELRALEERLRRLERRLGEKEGA